MLGCSIFAKSSCEGFLGDLKDTTISIALFLFCESGCRHLSWALGRRFAEWPMGCPLLRCPLPTLPLCTVHGVSPRVSADLAVTLRRTQCCRARILRGGSAFVRKAHPRDACCQGRCLSFPFSFRLSDKLCLCLQMGEAGGRIMWTTEPQSLP